MYLDWLKTSITAVPGWIDTLGQSIGIESLFSVLVGLTCFTILVSYLVLPATKGKGSDKSKKTQDGD